jgi:uracil-DNA glycosylase family 4
MVPRVGGEGHDNARIGAPEAASLLDWWLESGVDALVQESPRNWLKPASALQTAPADPEPSAQTSPPENLAAFQEWLERSDAIPLAPAAARRVLPHGVEQAAVMVIADAPGQEDAAAGQPIGGDAWELTKRMLAAIGMSSDEAYFASLSCAYAPGARLAGKELEVCADIARRHIALVKPKRLILLGDGPSRALLGKPVAQARGHIHKIEGVRTVSTFHPRLLMKQASNKALAWRDLLLLMEEDS